MALELIKFWKAKWEEKIFFLLHLGNFLFFPSFLTSSFFFSKYSKWENCVQLKEQKEEEQKKESIEIFQFFFLPPSPSFLHLSSIIYFFKVEKMRRKKKKTFFLFLSSLPPFLYQQPKRKKEEKRKCFYNKWMNDIGKYFVKLLACNLLASFREKIRHDPIQ